MSSEKVENLNHVKKIENSLTKEQSSNIDEVFEDNPEIATLFKNNKEFYQEYLNSIFPNSKIKEILWHGTISENKIEKFNHEYQYNKKGVTYFGNLKQAIVYKDKNRGRMYSVLINSKNPYIQKLMPNENLWATDQLEKEHLDSFREAGYDAIIGEGIFVDTERIIFEPEQIHILGSEQDILQAKEWLKSKQL